MKCSNKHELKEILDKKSIKTVFQAIVSLKDASIIGYEALSRGPEGSSLYFPDKLFSAAEHCGKTWDMELLCRTKAIEKAWFMKKDKFLFLNVDPRIFKDERFKSGFTKEFLKEYNISPNSIIFEITEKRAIEDYESFKKALKHYISQGYKIAIDDMGTGYSGLRTLMETKPHYIKIDMSFIRGIDSDLFKQEIVKTFVTLSRTTGMKIIAEGIETERELSKLINLGISLGQGYLLQRPSNNFFDISEDIKEKIIRCNSIQNNTFKVERNCIGDIALKNPSFSINSTSKEVKKFFDSSNINGVCITKDGRPLGLIMQHDLDYVLATQYGISVFLKRPVSLVMDSSPMIVDYNDSIRNVSKAAMIRNPKKIYDYVIVTKENKYYGIVTIKSLLNYTVEFEKNYAKNLNPLTGLPGNEIINKTLTNMLGYNGNFF